MDSLTPTPSILPPSLSFSQKSTFGSAAHWERNMKSLGGAMTKKQHWFENSQGTRDPQQLIHAKPPLMKTIWCTLCCSIPVLTAKLRRHLASMRIQLPVLTTIPARRGWTKWATNEATKRSVLSLLLQHTQAPMNYIYSWNFATIYRLSHHLLTFLVQIFWKNRNPASWQR